MPSYYYDPSSDEVWTLDEDWLAVEVAAHPEQYLRRDYAIEGTSDGYWAEVRDASGAVVSERDLTVRERRFLADEVDAHDARMQAEAKDFAAECGGRWA